MDVFHARGSEGCERKTTKDTLRNCYRQNRPHHTGKRALAGQRDAIFEVFRTENAPIETVSNSKITGPGATSSTNPVQDLF